jgi:putative membrane protein
MLVRDHTNNDAKVREVASASGITLMTPEETHRCLCAEKGEKYGMKRDHLAHLRTLRGAEFDREFSNMMAHGHQEVIDMVEDAQDEVDNPRVKVLLAQTLPTLRAHEQQAQRIAAYPEDMDR